jgi:hypothetical protein
MYIVLTKEDITSFSPALRAELLASAFPKVKPSLDGIPAGFDEDDFEGVVDLSPRQVVDFIDGCAEETVAGLKVFAEHGPVIHGSLLNAVGIENYSHFQGRVTKRTRTVTKDPEAFLFAWDNWADAPKYRALRVYFLLD